MFATISLRKAFAGLAVSAVAGSVVAFPGAAEASDLTVRLAPLSNSALFVDVSGGSKASTARVIQWTVSGDNQVWTFKPYGDYYEMVNKNSKMCLETDRVPGDQLFQAPCDGNAGEIWEYEEANDLSASKLIWNPSSYLYIDVYGGSTTRGAAIPCLPG